MDNNDYECRALGQLNDRLAAYINKVRTLELENSALQQQVSTIEETNSREVISVRTMYDKELGQVQLKFELFNSRFKD